MSASIDIQSEKIAPETAELLSARPKEEPSQPSSTEQSTRPEDSESWRDALGRTLDAFQSITRQTLADPEFAPPKVFKLCVPLYIFLYVLMAGLIIVRSSWVQNLAAADDVLGYAGELLFVVTMFGGCLLLGLGALWGALWIAFRWARAFAEMDLKNMEWRKKAQPGAFEMSQSNLLFGGLFNTSS